jgi:hypothetical protein
MDANSSIPHGTVKPGGGPKAVQPASRKQAVEFFSQTISGLYEKDYGDFMRKAVLYIDRLRDNLSGAGPDLSRTFEKMMAYTVYATDFDIESTRLKLMRDASELSRKV